jgi:glycerol-3-phosphate dehydrogenase subunit C
LTEARALAEQNTELMYAAAARGQKFLFCEPSCLSAIKEDAPGLLRGELQKKAYAIGSASMLFEDYLSKEVLAGRAHLNLNAEHGEILVHAHCHQKAMGMSNATAALLERIPGATVKDSGAGCCGMAGSFGYAKEKFELSKQIAGQRLLPAIEANTKKPGSTVVASGFSCRHQIKDFGHRRAVHPAMLVRSLWKGGL